MPARKKKVNKEKLRKRLKVKSLESRIKLYENNPHVKKFFKEKNFDLSDVRKHSARVVSAGAIASALLLSPPSMADRLPLSDKVVKKATEEKTLRNLPQRNFVAELSTVLPKKPRTLSTDEEKKLEQIIKNLLGVSAKATLEGEHLNTTFGRIGAEQHLRRYPGDTLADHGERAIQKEGIAPGLGAWGYFANSKDKLTPELAEVEKWYGVVQTLYLPHWSTRQPYLKNWYKYRKILIVNTDNGNAVVASVADSGPAAWTGKHFGGSPEVMMHLGGPRYKKGPVLVFFVDDPENSVPLGPVDYNNIDLPALALAQT